MSIHLWLVRHGATDWSDAGRLNGWTDVPLNDRGRVQARLLRRQLAQREFTGVWSSDLARAAETARLAVGKPVLEPSLRELDFGHLEGKRWEDLPAAVQEGLVEFGGFEAPGGDSTSALRRRVVSFLRGLPDGEHLLFTHGGVIRVLQREGGRDARVAPGELLRLRLNGCGGRRFVLIEERLP